MAAGLELVIGAEVRCSGGAACGEVKRLVVDPTARTVTHLVVRVKHRRILDRLVPVGLVHAAEAGSGVRLGCSVDEFGRLDPAEEKHQAEGSSFGYFVGPGAGPGPAVMPVAGRPEVVTEETVPFGEVDVHGGDTVRASDGEIGQVDGMVIDPGDQAVTHVLLEVRHLVLGHKHVAVPIEMVATVATSLEVNLTKQQVRDLPPVETDAPDEEK